MNIISKRVFIPSPGPGIGAMGAAYYCKKSGSELISYLTHISRSDTADVCYIKRSLDNGRTWGDSITWDMDFDHPDGTGRRHPRGGYVDPVTGRYILIWTEGVLPTDDPLEGFKQWTLHYSVSENGDRSRLVEGQIIHDGVDFSPSKHMPGIELGKNAMMIGDLGCRPLTRNDGVIVVPVQVSPVGEDGYYTNPGGGLTYTDAMMLLGTWNPDGSLRWTCSERIIGDVNRNTRGMVEPTIAMLDDGKMLCVMRGSNDVRPELPGYRWYSLSSDGGETWSVPEPWRYTGNTSVQPFHSPSSMSQLTELSDGRVFWIGNICNENPRGNSPRYPLLAVQVDRGSGHLIKDSTEIIDDRMEGENEALTLSNFFVREERESGDILLYLPRLFAQNKKKPGGETDFTSDLLEYRFSL